MKCFYNLKPFTDENWDYLKRETLTSYFDDPSDKFPVPYIEEDEWIHKNEYKAHLFAPDILEIVFEDGTEYIISKDGKFWIKGSVKGIIKWRDIKWLIQNGKYPDFQS